MLQRLQQRMEKRKINVQEIEPELLSFYPEIDDGKVFPIIGNFMAVNC